MTKNTNDTQSTRRRRTTALLLLLATALAGAVARAGRGSAAGGAEPAGAPARFTAPGGGPVSFTGRLDRTAVLQGGDGVVRMELVLGAAPDEVRHGARVPTDLVVILDRSGSMGGEKITHARRAVRELVSQLGPDDRFALVTYSDQAALVLPLAQADADARETWLRTVDTVAADGSTNMSSGLDLALATIEGARRAGRVPRVILISDGLANQGDASPEGLVRRAGRAARGEYMLSTVGVGEDFNEYLMTALADAGTGNYYYLRGAEDLSTVFAGEFNGARHTVASGLAVRIEPAPGVRVEDVAGYPLERDGGAVVVRPGALFAGQERRLWVTLAVPHDAAGDRDLGRFALSYDDGHDRVTRAFAETPRVACVRGEAEFYAGVDVPAWTRSVVDEAYQSMQSEVAREVKAGRRDEALGRIQKFREGTAKMNAQLQSPPVAKQLESLDKLEKDVAATFTAPEPAAAQNAFSKAKSAESRDQRRAGSKR